MNDNRKAAFTLIAGSIGGMITMAIHPTGPGKLDPDHIGHLGRMSGIVHSLALVSIVLLFLGCCGLTRILAAPNRIAISALVTFGFSCGAIMIAATISGFVIPDIIRLMARDEAANANQWRIAIASVFAINQAMARIYSVGTALAITLWSVCSLRQHQLSRGMATFGCVTAPLVALLVCAGHLRLDVHGMTAVVLSEVVWFTGMGIALLREK